MRKCLSNYSFKTKKIKNVVIAHISDIHFAADYNLKRLQFLSNELKKVNPTYICITGDIIDNGTVLDDNKSYEILSSFLQQISSFSKVIITLGNHEMKGYLYSDKIYEKIIVKIKKIPGIVLLNNEIYVDNDICFVGFNPSYEYYEKKGRDSSLFVRDYKAFDPFLDQNRYNVLLVHTPKDLLSDYIYDCVKNFDLILSGHTHGGMMPVNMWGHMGIISPGKRLFPKNIRGHMLRNNTNLIICSGVMRLSNSSHLFRYFNWVYAIHINVIKLNKE